MTKHKTVGGSAVVHVSGAFFDFFDLSLTHYLNACSPKTALKSKKGITQVQKAHMHTSSSLTSSMLHLRVSETEPWRFFFFSSHQFLYVLGK